VLRPILPSLTAALLLAAVASGQGLTPAITESRDAIKEPPARAGLEVVKRHLVMGNASVQYERTVDPNQADKPVDQQYGDYRLGLAFPGGWNWDLEYFLDVQVTRPALTGETPVLRVEATRAMLQEGIWALQEGRRAVAEMVWPLPPLEGAEAGKLAVRLVKAPEEPTWLYLEARIDGEPEAQISQLRVGAYPFITSGPPERQRWVTTLANAYHMTDAATKLDAADDWGMVLHNKLAQEEGGCLFVYDPECIEAVSAAGTYNVQVFMTPKAGTRAVKLALGYFWDELYVTAVAKFRQEAPQVLERLRKLDWSVPLDAEQWAKAQAEMTGLIEREGLAGEFGDRWQALMGDMAAAQTAAKQDGPAARLAERQFGLLLKRAKSLKEEMYAAALKRLLAG
jgi:hypothetical protein